jgi:hypothetical protein
MSDYIVDENNAIEYKMDKKENGWVLSVKFPSKTSVSDHCTVLDWIRDYQRNVKHQHPHWLTSFRETERGYLLFIQPAEDVHELVRAVDLISESDRVRDYWSKSLEYAG